jgi:hypothetical protein
MDTPRVGGASGTDDRVRGAIHVGSQTSPDAVPALGSQSDTSRSVPTRKIRAAMLSTGTIWHAGFSRASAAPDDGAQPRVTEVTGSQRAFDVITSMQQRLELVLVTRLGVGHPTGDRRTDRAKHPHRMRVLVGVAADDGVDDLCNHGHCGSGLLPGNRVVVGTGLGGGTERLICDESRGLPRTGF